jgi:hypothetical protein
MYHIADVFLKEHDDASMLQSYRLPVSLDFLVSLQLNGILDAFPFYS